MFSVNQKARKIIHYMIENKELMNIEVHELSNGATVIDTGLNCPGSWAAARFLVEATLGGLGQVQYSTMELEGLELPQVEIYVDQPAIACLSCQLSGWPLPEAKNQAGIVPLISGPARAVVCKDRFAQVVDYQDHSPEVVAAIQDNVLPDEKLTQLIATECKVDPRGVFILLAPTGSLVGSINVVARTLETAIWRLHTLGLDIKKTYSAWGKAPLPPVTKDEYQAMIRTNVYTYYGGTAAFFIEEDDEKIERIIKEIPLSPRTTRNYGRSFSELLDEAGGNIFNVTDFVHNVTKIIMHNSKTGSTFQEGEIDLQMLKSCL